MSQALLPNDTEILLTSDVGRELGLTPAAIRAAAVKGQIRTAAITARGVRLFDRKSVTEFSALRESRSRK